MTPSRILRINNVLAISGLSRSSVYRLIKEGLFPKPIKIGIAAVGWVADEIEQWISDCRTASRAISREVL